jgi:hypothetical protein
VRKLGPLTQWEPPPPPNEFFCPEYTNQEQAEADLRKFIALSLREIAKPRPGAGQIRKKLAKLASDLRRAQAAAKALPDGALSIIDADQKLLSDLERMRLATEQQSDKIPVKPTGGNSDRMLLAASRARHLMIGWTEKPVTLTDDSDYIKLAALLYRLATGKRANLKKPCARHLREIRNSLTATGEPKPPDWLR